nr:hypothetical protein [Tanacetum cinerariifolium]
DLTSVCHTNLHRPQSVVGFPESKTASTRSVGQSVHSLCNRSTTTNANVRHVSNAFASSSGGRTSNNGTENDLLNANYVIRTDNLFAQSRHADNSTCKLPPLKSVIGCSKLQDIQPRFCPMAVIALNRSKEPIACNHLLASKTFDNKQAPAATRGGRTTAMTLLCNGIVFFVLYKYAFDLSLCGHRKDTCFWKACTYVLMNTMRKRIVHICSNEFDEKAQRAHMF